MKFPSAMTTDDPALFLSLCMFAPTPEFIVNEVKHLSPITLGNVFFAQLMMTLVAHSHPLHVFDAVFLPALDVTNPNVSLYTQLQPSGMMFPICVFSESPHV